MKPFLNDTKHTPLDILIIGGGITGAGLFRDAALHGLRVLLVDKKDFSSQTSQASSKMLHGGIRYLETLELDLVSESLHEKNLWLKIAPHLCYEQPFHLPIYKGAARPPWMMKMGLALYDLLSEYKNTPHRYLHRDETLKAITGLKSEHLYGCGVYYDAVVEDAKLTLEVLYDGLIEPFAEALNYVELVEFNQVNDSGLLEVKLRDTLTQKEFFVFTKNLLFATGPFTDQLLAKFKDLNWTPKLLPSKGSHLWVHKEKLPIDIPVVLTPPDGRIIFVIPQRGSILVGTTEVEVSADEDYFDIRPSEAEVAYLLNNLNEFFPRYHVTVNDIHSSFAGIRPLVKDGLSDDRSKAARTHQCYWPRHNIGVVLGGKYTTFRVMAQDLLRPVMKRLQKAYDTNRTLAPLRRPSIVPPFSPVQLDQTQVDRIYLEERARTQEDVIKRRLGSPHPGLEHPELRTPENV